MDSATAKVSQVERAAASGRVLRVRRFYRLEAEYGYVGLYRHDYQALQERRWWGWKTIDVEEVPQHVLIARGATGSDVSRWRSRFASLGRFGAGGVIAADAA